MTNGATIPNGKLWTAVITALVCITGTGGIAYSTLPSDRIARVEEITTRNCKELDQHLKTLTILQDRLSEQCAAMVRIETKLDAALARQE